MSAIRCGGVIACGWMCVWIAFVAGCKPPKMPVAGGLVAADQTGDEKSAAATVTPVNSPQPSSSAEFMPAAIGNSPPGAPPVEPVASQTPPATSIPLVANPGLIPVDQANGGSRGQNAAGQNAASATDQTAAASAGLAIHLSAGIAVPQSLPTGTQMGMSVDYAIGGRLNASSRFVWVISSEGGGEIEAEVKLKTRGTLTSFVPNLRPEDRPFNCRIEEIMPGGRRVRVSNVAPLQTSY